MGISFFDILGINRSLSNLQRAEAAAEIWPGRHVHFLTGDIDTSESVTPLMEYLQFALKFKAISPGANESSVGFYAAFDIVNPPAPKPLVLHTMPDVEFYLQTSDPSNPPRCFATKTDNGVEIVLEALPVEIRLPAGMLEPLEPSAVPQPPSPLISPFIPGVHDSFAVTLKSTQGSSIFTHIKLRITEEWDVILEPAVILSVGPCLFSGLPCFGLHDIAFIPTPSLSESHAAVEQAVEWTRHTIEPADFGMDSNFRGVLSIRTIDVDSSKTPFKELSDWLNTGMGEPGNIQFVIEDVVFPFFNILLMPVPIHATLGIRRNIEFNAGFEEIFSFANTPIKIALGGFIILIEEFLVESFAPDNIEDSQIARIKIAITRGELPKVTTLTAAFNSTQNNISVADLSVFEGKEFTVIINRNHPVLREDVEVIREENATVLTVKNPKPPGTPTPQHAAGDSIEIDLFSNNAITLNFVDDWTVQAGWRRQEAFRLFIVGEQEFKMVGAKLGFSFKRLYENNHGIKDYKWYEYWQLLVDLNLEAKPSQNGYVRFEVLSDNYGPNSEPVNIAWHDVGYNFGAPTLGGAQLPEGLQIVLFNYFKIIVQEIAVLTDKNGGTYFSISGGIGVEGEKYAAQILVHRFRWRIAGNPEAAKLLLDGISFDLKINRFHLYGTGMSGEFSANGHVYNELKFELGISFPAFGKEFSLAALFYKGEVSGPTDNFKYWMFGLHLGYLPIGGLDLYNIRTIAVSNMTPNLAPPDGTVQQLRTYKWYKNATDPLVLPSDRKMNAWKPLDDSWALGVGAGASFGGTKAVLLDVFGFYHDSPAEKGFMLAFNLFLLKSKKPIGFGVLDIDIEHGNWAAMVGVNLSPENLLPEGFNLPLLGNVAALSGNLYMGNNPCTFALGQLNDQNTWIGFRMRENRFFTIEFIIAICLQYVEREEGPKGFGLLISGKGGASFGVGKAEFYLNFLLIAGTWKNESSTGGLILLFEAGFRIKLFRVFRFGASLKVQIDFLGAEPEYKRIAFEIHIDTPWYLPDVTIRFEKTFDEPRPAEQPMVSTPIISAEAIQAGSKQPALLMVTALNDQISAPNALFSLETLRNLAQQFAAQQDLDAMSAVSVDSTIALNFKQPVDDKLSIGENTPPGAGTQKATAPAESELTITYELVSLSIRRQPRYGSSANQWTTVLAPDQTIITDLENWPPDAQVSVLFSSDFKVLWDRDVQIQSRFDPRRLLINAATPFTVTTQNQAVDESLLIWQPGWPCCGEFDGVKKVKSHLIHYPEIMLGQQVPGAQLFTESSSTLHWLTTPKPLVAPSKILTGQPAIAKVFFDIAGTHTFAVVNFDQPAFHFKAEWYWQAQHRLSYIIVEAYNGLNLLKALSFSLSAAKLDKIELQNPVGFTSLKFKFLTKPENEPSDGTSKSFVCLELLRMEYKTVQEEVDGRSMPEKCGSHQDSLLNGKGKLAWLPNHNYEITAVTRILLNHNQTGTQEALTTQRTYFRTKGMIGLNWVESVGQEITPYLEAVYPGAETPIIYREEPIVMAFNEQFNLLLPVDRDISLSNPAELNQILEWDLTVDKEGDAIGNNRISKSGKDWIVDHRAIGLSNPVEDISVLVEGFLSKSVRKAKSLVAQQMRLANIVSAPGSCSQTPKPPSSQVLMHMPVDPSSSTPAGLWEKGRYFKANLKQKNGPFINRNPFTKEDLSAFIFFASHGQANDAWVFTAGNIELDTNIFFGSLYYAAFGDNDWNHLEIGASVSANNGIAGIAVGLRSTSSTVQSALLVLVDDANKLLIIKELQNGVITPIAQTALPESIIAPYRIDIITYDDKLEAKIDDAKLVVERGSNRAGKLALVGENSASFHSLTVEALDAYRFNFQSSRFVSFEAQMSSLGAHVDVIPTGLAQSSEPALVQALLSEHEDAILNVMKPGANKAARFEVFHKWAEALAVPMRQNSERVSVSRLHHESGDLLFLVESPEPLRFSSELSLKIERELNAGAVQPSQEAPGFDALEKKIPDNFTVFQTLVPEKFSGIKKLKLVNKKLVQLNIHEKLASKLPKTSTYALLSIQLEGKLSYFLFKLTLASINPLNPEIRQLAGQLVSPADPVLTNNLFFAQNIKARLGGLGVQSLQLLNSQGVLLDSIDLWPLYIPYFVEQKFLVLSDGNETRAFIIPINNAVDHQAVILPSGKYRWIFNLRKERYRNTLADANAVYEREHVWELDFV